MVSPIEGEGREVRFTDIPREKDRDRQTKRRSAPHETLIESIHRDSGQGNRKRQRVREREREKGRNKVREGDGGKNRLFRDTNGASGVREAASAKVCLGSLRSTRCVRRSRTRTLKSSIQARAERAEALGGDTRRPRERGKIPSPPNLYAIPPPYSADLRVSRVFFRPRLYRARAVGR